MKIIVCIITLIMICKVEGAAHSEEKKRDETKRRIQYYTWTRKSYAESECALKRFTSFAWTGSQKAAFCSGYGVLRNMALRSEGASLDCAAYRIALYLMEPRDLTEVPIYSQGSLALVETLVVPHAQSSLLSAQKLSFAASDSSYDLGYYDTSAKELYLNKGLTIHVLQRPYRESLYDFQPFPRLTPVAQSQHAAGAGAVCTFNECNAPECKKLLESIETATSQAASSPQQIFRSFVPPAHVICQGPPPPPQADSAVTLYVQISRMAIVASSPVKQKR